MNLSNKQENTLKYFESWLYAQKEEINNCFKKDNGNVNVELDLRREYFGLEDYLGKIIDQFLIENYMHWIIKDDDGNWANIKISMDFQEELGFIKLLIRFVR